MGKSEDRKHRRYEVEEPAFMRVLGPAGGAFVITILDISEKGLRIRCPRPLPDRTPIEIRCRGTMIGGEIRYSRAMDANDVHVGILATSVGGKPDDFDLTLLFPDLMRR